MFFRLRWSLDPMTHEDIVYYKQGGYAYPEMLPGTWKTKANVWNDYEVEFPYTFASMYQFWVRKPA